MTRPHKAIDIQPDAALYPKELRSRYDDYTPPVLTAMGNQDLLARPKLAFFCSQRCPGRLILRSVDLANELAETDITVVGGFHTPVEREFLRVVLRGRASAVICPARSLERMRVPAELRQPLDVGRLLFISPLTSAVRRPTQDTSCARNRLVIALAERVLIGYAEPGGMTERAVHYAKDAGKHVC